MCSKCACCQYKSTLNRFEISRPHIAKLGTKMRSINNQYHLDEAIGHGTISEQRGPLSTQDAGSETDNIPIESTEQDISVTGLKHQMDAEKLNNTSIRVYLQPLLLCLAVCGCHSFDNLGTTDHELSTRSWIKRCVACLYRGLIFLVMVAAIFKFTMACFSLPRDDLMTNGLHIIWQTLCTFHYFGNLKTTSAKYGKQESSFNELDNILEDFHKLGIVFPETKIKRRINVGISIGCFIILVNVAGVGLQIALHVPSRAFYSAPFETNWVVISLAIVAQAIFTLIWIFQWIYAITICFILKHTFKSYSEYLKYSFCKSNCKVPVDIQTSRVLHLKLCDLVQSLDKDIGWFFACTFVFNIGLACMALYQLIKMDLDVYRSFLFIFWLATVLILLALVMTFAAIVNEEAHAPLGTIYKIEVQNASLDQVMQLNLFLSKLTGTQVGFTTFGLLTITKEFILTIAGVFLTYFAVLYTL